MNAIEIEHISKNYKTVSAVKDISLSVEEGEIFGLIGPDGAGKTTLFRIMTTLMLADAGKGRICGFDIVKDYAQIRQIIGYMPGRFSLYQDLSVQENIDFFATMFGTTLQDNYETIREIYSQIEPFRKRKAGKLSGGMKQKLALSCVLIHKPEVLFLDEPTTGVDPVSRKEFWGMLLKLKRQGITILVSTPYMDEATLCDRIALMQEGRFIGTDTPQGIIAHYPDKLLAVQSDNMHKLLADLHDYQQVKSSYSFGETFHVTLRDQSPADELKAYLKQRGHSDVNIRSIAPSIEDCFMLLSNKTRHER